MEKNVKHEQEPTPLGKRETMSGGRRVQVYIDTRSLHIASQLGNGNISSGIRRALDKAGMELPAQKQPKPD